MFSSLLLLGLQQSVGAKLQDLTTWPRSAHYFPANKQGGTDRYRCRYGSILVITHDLISSEKNPQVLVMRLSDISLSGKPVNRDKLELLNKALATFSVLPTIFPECSGGEVKINFNLIYDLKVERTEQIKIGNSN